MSKIVVTRELVDEFNAFVEVVSDVLDNLDDRSVDDILCNGHPEHQYAGEKVLSFAFWYAATYGKPT